MKVLPRVGPSPEPHPPVQAEASSLAGGQHDGRLIEGLQDMVERVAKKVAEAEWTTK